MLSVFDRSLPAAVDELVQRLQIGVREGRERTLEPLRSADAWTNVYASPGRGKLASNRSWEIKHLAEQRVLEAESRRRCP